MSSKIGTSQPQGRRTPLSLTSKHAQQQQHQQNNKGNNSNSTKSHESKSEAITKNGNNNSDKNQETNHMTQKELKKAAAAAAVAAAAAAVQQNGNGTNANVDVIIISDEIEADKPENGTANGHKNDKNNGQKAEATKEKVNEANGKDKPKKQQETAATKQAEVNKEPNESEEKSIAEQQTKVDASAVAAQENEKPQATKSNEGEQSKPATPPKVNEKSKANQTPPSSKSGTPSKSPRASTRANRSANSVSEAATAAASATADVEMLPLVVETSPAKVVKLTNPAATSTPGKGVSQSVKQTKAEILLNNKKANKSAGASPEQSLTNVPRVFSQISGRRSIRPLEEYTSTMYNSQFRESYRRINTELDVTGNTNTSMNATVGSEIPNNSSFLSFSFLGRGRKRERTPPPPATPGKSQSTVELSTTPPKKARLDVQSIFTAVASPLTLLRSRFSKTTLESSTPAKINKASADAEDDVQNVSGVSIEETVGNSNSKNGTELAAEGANVTVGQEAEADKTPKKKSTPSKAKNADNDLEILDVIDLGKAVNDSKEATGGAMDVDSDINIKETPLIAAVGEPQHKQRGCAIM